MKYRWFEGWDQSHNEKQIFVHVKHLSRCKPYNAISSTRILFLLFVYFGKFQFSPLSLVNLFPQLNCYGITKFAHFLSLLSQPKFILKNNNNTALKYQVVEIVRTRIGAWTKKCIKKLNQLISNQLGPFSRLFPSLFVFDTRSVPQNK